MKLVTALSETARQLGVATVTCVPGQGATQTFEACRSWHDAPFSWHEEVAYGLAVGSALYGRPALCLVKLHGLLKAANAVVCSLSAGVRAGLVTLVFDDPDGSHSDNILHPERALEGLEMPYWKPVAEEVCPAVVRAFQASQISGLPQAVVVDSRALESEVELPPVAALEPPRIELDPVDQLVCPLYGGYQRARLEARLGRALAPPAKPRLAGLEELPGPWAEALESYRPWMDAALAHGRPALVAGDTGLSSLFGLEPYRAVDVIGWMGGSVPLAAGALLAGAPSAWAVTGDFAFGAAGLLGWLEVRRRHLPLQVLLFENGKAQATGGQDLNLACLEGLLSSPEVVAVDEPAHLRLQPGPSLYRLNCRPT